MDYQLLNFLLQLPSACWDHGIILFVLVFTYIFQFKLSMTKTQLDWTCDLRPFCQCIFLLCSHSWVKHVSGFPTYIDRVEISPTCLRMFGSIPLGLTYLASLVSTMPLQTHSSLVESTCGFLNMHSHSLLPAPISLHLPFPSGLSFKTCWFKTAI